MYQSGLGWVLLRDFVEVDPVNNLDARLAVPTYSLSTVCLICHMSGENLVKFC